MRMICSPGFLLPGKKAARVQWLRTGFFSPKFQLSGLGIVSKLTNSAASTRISEAQNHPLESLPSAISPPHPRTQQNKLCKNETWETLHSKGQPHTGTLLDLYKSELQPELPYENHLLLFSKPKLSSAEVSDLFWGCGRVIFLVLFDSIKKISCSLREHSALKSRNWSRAQWDSLSNNSSLFSEDLYAPNSISICYKCNIATGDKLSCDVNQCSGSDVKELHQISSAVTLTQCWWIAHSISREVRTIKFECQEQ